MNKYGVNSGIHSLLRSLAIRDIETRYRGTMFGFLWAVVYPVSSTPSLAPKLIYVNPLTFPIEELRDVLFFGNQLHWLHWLAYFSVANVVAVSGLWLFQKSRPAFADVI